MADSGPRRILHQRSQFAFGDTRSHCCTNMNRPPNAMVFTAAYAALGLVAAEEAGLFTDELGMESCTLPIVPLFETRCLGEGTLTLMLWTTANGAYVTGKRVW